MALPQTRHFWTKWPEARRGTGDGAFIYALSADETGPTPVSYTHLNIRNILHLFIENESHLKTSPYVFYILGFVFRA